MQKHLKFNIQLLRRLAHVNLARLNTYVAFKFNHHYSSPPLQHLTYTKNFTTKRKLKSGKTSAEEQEEISDKKNFDFDIKTFQPKFDNVKERLKQELNSLKLGRANPAILDTVIVDVGEEYGGNLPLKKVGQVSIKDNQNLYVAVYEPKLLKAVEKAIQNANLNLNPTVENGKLKVPIPKLTSDTRTQLTKQIQNLGEKSKVNVRHYRQEIMKKLASNKKKGSGVSTDAVKEAEKEVQQVTEDVCKWIDQCVNDKVNEIKK